MSDKLDSSYSRDTVWYIVVLRFVCGSVRWGCGRIIHNLLSLSPSPSLSFLVHTHSYPSPLYSARLFYVSSLAAIRNWFRSGPSISQTWSLRNDPSRHRPVRRRSRWLTPYLSSSSHLTSPYLTSSHLTPPYPIPSSSSSSSCSIVYATLLFSRWPSFDHRTSSRARLSTASTSSSSSSSPSSSAL